MVDTVDTIPSKSGISHTFAAFIALAVAPLIRELIPEVIAENDLTAIIAAVGYTIARYPQNPIGSAATASALQLLAIAVLTFLWGYAYHISRHH